VQPALPVPYPPRSHCQGNGTGVSQMTFAPFSQEGRGAGWEVGESFKGKKLFKKLWNAALQLASVQESDILSFPRIGR